MEAEPSGSPAREGPSPFIGSPDPGRRRRPPPGLGLTLALMAAVVAVNVAAVWGIVGARRSAEEAARSELALSTAAHARSLEAVLATLRGDLIFLAQSPPLVRYPEAAGDPDPLVRRWGRLDVEGTLLLFLEAHPAVERLVVRDAAGAVLAAAGRRQGAPALLPPEGAEAAAPPPGLWPSSWPIGPPDEPRGALGVWIEPRALLAVAAPAVAERLRLEVPAVEGAVGDGAERPSDPGAPRPEAGAQRSAVAAEPGSEAGAAAPAAPAAGHRVARAEVRDRHWQPPVRWTLVRSEEGSRLVQSVESLAARYRRTVALNLAVILLSLGLGLAAFRQARRSARLEAAAEQQARVRELERQLFHSERLASVGRLAAGLAHEINNPLEGMTNYLTLLRDDLAAGRAEDARELVRPLSEGLARVAGILRQVLAFADPGRTPKSRLDLARVVGRTAEFVRANPAYRGVRIGVALPADPLPVVGNEVTLGQLVLNLLVNACQCQPEDGEVEITARRGGGHAEVTVADRGRGLPPEVREHLFEPFVSTRGSTGLGLAVCHGIAEDHRGRITAGDRPGGGTVFRFELPLAGEETAAPAAAVSAAARPEPAARAGAEGGR